MRGGQAERWLALEFVAVVAVRTAYGFSEQKGLLGASNYAAILAAFGLLSILVLSETTAEIAPVLGGLIVLAVLLRPSGKSSTVGRDTARGIAAFTEHVGSTAPTVSRGFGGGT